jgi:hypothetical protein
MLFNGPSDDTVVFASGNGTLDLNQPLTFTGVIRRHFQQWRRAGPPRLPSPPQSWWYILKSGAVQRRQNERSGVTPYG